MGYMRTTTSGNFIPHSVIRIPNSRRAFTLIELLVVIAIMALLASITLLFLPKRETRLASQGADQLQTYIASARSRALRDQAPRGVRLILDGAGFREVQLLEVPEALAPGITMTIPIGGSTATFAAGFDSSSLRVGDFLEVVYGAGSVHKITGPTTDGVNLIPPTATNPMTFASPVPAATITQLQLSNNYRIIRQARPLMGEPTLQLPNTVLVLPNIQASPNNFAPASQNIPGTDIMFSPSGQVIGATSGRIVLWVTDDNSVSKPTLLTIYTRTGGVAAHPVAPWTPSQVVSATNNPYSFTQDGRSSGQ